MTVLFELGAVAVAMACALHMYWRMRKDRRRAGSLGANRAGSELVESQRVLAKRVETFSRNGPTPDRH
jgi:hypothetical protein